MCWLLMPGGGGWSSAPEAAWTAWSRWTGVHIRVLAGVSMARAAVFAANLGLSGLEFAHGIPGSVGGGLYMNAGAYGGEIRQVAVRTEFLDQEGIHHTLEGEEQGFGYRKSAFTGTSRVIVAGTFALTPGAPEEIRQPDAGAHGPPQGLQPLDLPSAGSTFKRPVGGYAAALIEQAGLKGTPNRAARRPPPSTPDLW